MHKNIYNICTCVTTYAHINTCTSKTLLKPYVLYTSTQCKDPVYRGGQWGETYSKLLSLIVKLVQMTYGMSGKVLSKGQLNFKGVKGALTRWRINRARLARSTRVNGPKLAYE